MAPFWQESTWSGLRILDSTSMSQNRDSIYTKGEANYG